MSKSLKDKLIKDTADFLKTPSDIIEAVVFHQFSNAAKAAT